MLTLLLGFVGFALFYVTGWIWLHDHPVWCGFIGIAGFLAAVLPLNVWLKRRMEAVFGRVQNILQENQEQLRRNAMQMQKGFSGSPKALQTILEKKQAEAVRAALVALDGVKPLQKWNLLAERQANTVRAQLHFQLKEYAEADQFLKKGFVLDPFTVCMKLSRAYVNGEKANLDKEFKKAVRRYKGDKATLLYALHSWILVKDGRAQEAMEVLAKGKDQTGNETLKVNWEHLANGRVRQFSNSGIGELWYALHLETPKPVRMRQQSYGGSPRFH